MKAVKFAFTAAEKSNLKKARIKVSELSNYAIDELGALLNISEQRAQSIGAHLMFQSLPSIGPKFAQDLIDMGYFNLEQLKHNDGAELLNEHERFIGYQTDPCVEDQFRLVVHYANHPNTIKQWWDFTAERKAYRAKYGYPENRPGVLWFDTEKYS